MWIGCVLNLVIARAFHAYGVPCDSLAINSLSAICSGTPMGAVLSSSKGSTDNRVRGAVLSYLQSAVDPLNVDL